MFLFIFSLSDDLFLGSGDCVGSTVSCNLDLQCSKTGKCRCGRATTRLGKGGGGGGGATLACEGC